MAKKKGVISQRDRKYIQQHAQDMSAEEIARQRGIDARLVGDYKREAGLERRLTRRRLLIGAGALGLVGLTSGISICTSTISEPRYKAFERSSLPATSLMEQILLEPGASSFFDSSISAELERTLQHALKNPRYNPQKPPIFQVFEQMIIAQESDIKFAEKYALAIRDSIDFALNYWSHPALVVPQISIKPTHNRFDLSKRIFDENELSVLLVHDSKSRRFVKINYDDGKEPEIFELGLVDVTGSYEPRYEIGYVGKSFSQRVRSTAPLILDLNMPPISLIAVPAEEVLHYQVDKYDRSNLVAALNRALEEEYQRKGVKDIGLLDELYGRESSKSIIRNEAFVHALGMLRFIAENEKVGWGFSREAINEHYFHSPYKGMLEMSERLSRMTPQQSIEMYITDDPRLFEGTGL